jgi:hypothetical protein
VKKESNVSVKRERERKEKMMGKFLDWMVMAKRRKEEKKMNNMKKKK